MFQNHFVFNCALQLLRIVIVIFFLFSSLCRQGWLVGWVCILLSSKLVKQSRIVQSAMYSCCDTVITTKVLTPAVHSQFVYSPGAFPLESINMEKPLADKTI